ncbi:hypothetical protein ACGF5F_32380 [Streptomyces sp. NPDC047821]|uniref:hypothetical protein n=1 Tax=Streptomyces sp. NPDC047821 TaxID=3365488 RepID=UPI0037204393
MAAPADRTPPQRQLLGALVKQRRTSLHLGKDEAAKACGVAPMTYRAVEEGRNVRDTTYAKIEARFGFTPGSCQAVLDGADSIKLDDGTELFEGAQARPTLDGLADELKSAITSAASLTAPDLTLKQTQDMTDLVVEELRRRGILPKAS